MSTPLGAKRVGPRKPLKRGTAIKKVSAKQAKRNRELAKIAPPVDGLCEWCKHQPDFRGLAKHHRVFRSHNGSDERSNLIWLCGTCHDLEHGIVDR